MNEMIATATTAAARACSCSSCLLLTAVVSVAERFSRDVHFRHAGSVGTASDVMIFGILARSFLSASRRRARPLTVSHHYHHGLVVRSLRPEG
jgi:hypothetical protein